MIQVMTEAEVCDHCGTDERTLGQLTRRAEAAERERVKAQAGVAFERVTVAELRAKLHELRSRAASQIEIETTARDEARAEVERLQSRLATIIDEAWGTQPLMSAEDLLTCLECRLFADRQERERLRGAAAYHMRERKALAEQRDAALAELERRLDPGEYEAIYRQIATPRAALAGEGEAPPWPLCCEEDCDQEPTVGPRCAPHAQQIVEDRERQRAASGDECSTPEKAREP